MKKNKNLLLLGGLVVGLALYAYFGEYKREVNETQNREISDKIVSLKKDQIQKIELKKGTGTQITLERTIDGWNMVTPVADQADNEIIEAFLDQILGEKAVDQLPEASPERMTEYGFKPSLGTVTLINNNGLAETIEISSKKNFEGLVFLKRNNENKILTSSESWTSFLTKPTDQFRNLRLFRGSISKVNTIRLTTSKGESVFKYTDGFWFSPQHIDWKIDQNAIREILTQVSLVKGTGIIAENKPYGPVGKHLLTIEFMMDKSTWKGFLHQDMKSKDVIGAIPSPNMIIRFPPQALEELRDKRVIDFRDKSEPFRFQKDQINKIIARTKLKSFTLVKKAKVWQLEKDDEETIVNSTLADELVNKLNRLTVYKFLDNKQPPKAGLDSDIELHDDAGKVVFQMSWGEFKDHEGLAQTNLYKEVFQMDDAQMSRLMFHEIVKPKTSKADPITEQENEIEKN